MKKIQMEVIAEPKPGTASVFITDQPSGFVYMHGQGSVDFVCGACEGIICEGMERGQLVQLVFRCPNCKSYNRVRGT